MAALASDWLKHFSTSSPQPLNGFWLNLTESKSLTPSIKFVFFVQIGNPRWPPWSLIGWNIFRLLLRNHWMDFDETLQEASPQRPLSSLCVSCRSEIQDGRPGLWFAETCFGFFSTTAEWILTKLARKTSPQHLLSSLSSSCRSEIQDGRPGLWLAETFFDFFSATAEWILTKLDRKQVLNALYQVCVFRVDRKSKMATLASDWLKHFFGFFSTTAEWILTKLDKKQVLNTFYQVLCFSYRSEIQDGRPGLWFAEIFYDFFSATAEWILTKLDRKQVHNALYQVCVFRADRKSKMAALVSDWLKHFSASSQQPLNGFWRNRTGSKSATPSIKFVFFVPIGNPRWPLL